MGLALLAACGTLGWTVAVVDAAPPAHLQAASDLLKTIAPRDTDYQHKGGAVVWADSATGARAECRTDCSGLVDALLKRAYGLNDAQLAAWFQTKRPVAKDYHAMVVAGRGFIPIASVAKMQPGDILAVLYPPGEANTGHVMLVADNPRQQAATPPLVNGTLQWEVPVIDSSHSAHGLSDTRHHADGTSGDGLGKGSLRIYTDANGKVLGYSWSEAKGSKYIDQSVHHLVIGRIDGGFIAGLKRPP
ncbi:MAG TPA: hypothetical protein VFE24_14335 [Pirellulales bacterium]|jgi:hypothetical protein|nr:hypothetical protein [Pirellulales bacterium]